MAVLLDLLKRSADGGLERVVSYQDECCGGPFGFLALAATLLPGKSTSGASVASVCPRAASVGAAGLQVFVDGVHKGSAPVFTADSATGYWRWGDGRVADWGYTPPSTSGFRGSIDEVAVYDTQLTPARIAAHYAER